MGWEPGRLRSASPSLWLLLLLLRLSIARACSPLGADSTGTSCNASDDTADPSSLCTCADVWTERVSATTAAGCVTSIRELTATCGDLLSPTSDSITNGTTNGTDSASANSTNKNGTEARTLTYGSPVYTYNASNFSLTSALLAGPQCAVPRKFLLATPAAHANTTSTASTLPNTAIPTSTAARHLFQEFQLSRKDTLPQASIRLGKHCGCRCCWRCVAANENCSLTHGYLQARRSVCRLCAPGLELFSDGGTFINGGASSPASATGARRRIPHLPLSPRLGIRTGEYRALMQRSRHARAAAVMPLQWINPVARLSHLTPFCCARFQAYASRSP